MSGQLRILVACGSGVATTTLAAKAVGDVCRERHIDASIDTCGIKEVDSAAKNADVILTTSKFDKDLGLPVMSIIAFVTGVRIKETKQKVGDLLENLVKV